MTETPTITCERVDDVPLLLGLILRLGIASLIDTLWPRHPHQQGLSYGTLVCIWLAYILSVGDHHKSHVRDWVARHRALLTEILGVAEIRETDCTDDRLGQVLHQLSHTVQWHQLEEAGFQHTLRVYPRLQPQPMLASPIIGPFYSDTTTSAGFHTNPASGVMHFGQSKDHRSDLRQFKLMAAGLSTGLLVATEVWPGNASDDPLYTPIQTRVRQILAPDPGQALFFVGDSKMGALATRAALVAQGDYYLTPLGRQMFSDDAWVALIEQGCAADTALEDVRRPVPPGATPEPCLARGYERPRAQGTAVHGVGLRWTERLMIVQSASLLQQEQQELADHLARAQQEVLALTRTPKRRVHQYTSEAELQETIAARLHKHQVSGLVRVTWQTEPYKKGVRYVITSVHPEGAAVRAAQARLGWRVYATNAPPLLTLPAAVLYYRESCHLERAFHLYKDQPLGIRPIAVQRDDQIIGLARLLTLGLRVMTVLETGVRAGLAQEAAPHQRVLYGLYAGQATRGTDQPTATRLLTAIAHSEITRVVVTTAPETEGVYLTPVPPLLERVLAYLELPPSLYTALGQPLASRMPAMSGHR